MAAGISSKGWGVAIFAEQREGGNESRVRQSREGFAQGPSLSQNGYGDTFY